MRQRNYENASHSSTASPAPEPGFRQHVFVHSDFVGVLKKNRSSTTSPRLFAGRAKSAASPSRLSVTIKKMSNKKRLQCVSNFKIIDSLVNLGSERGGGYIQFRLQN